MLFPSVRPGPDHAHMAPAICAHLKNNNYEDKPDFLGRKNAVFYKNNFKQDLRNENKPSLVKQFNKHGFSF